MSDKKNNRKNEKRDNYILDDDSPDTDYMFVNKKFQKMDRRRRRKMVIKEKRG